MTPQRELSKMTNEELLRECEPIREQRPKAALCDEIAKRLRQAENENALLRKLLWIRHDSKHSYGLYGDDGEMQCGICLIDFKRMSAQDIENTWSDRATKLLRQIQAEKASAGK
jgi:hypothetical protein